MKWLSIAIVLLASLAWGRTYTTNFPLTENPICESNGVSCRWFNGATNGGTCGSGSCWTNMQTVPHIAFGTMAPSPNFNDSIALLTGTWGPTQTVTTVVHSVTASGSDQLEAEIRLRSTITNQSSTGYECDMSQGFLAIVRWNGAQGNFTNLNATGPGTGLVNGHTMTCSVTGTNPVTITITDNGTTVKTATDTGAGGFGPWTSGAPGMGWFTGSSSPDPTKSDLGWASLTATDEVIVNAASCSSTDVQTAINNSSATTVQLPTCTSAVSWGANAVTINRQLTLAGNTTCNVVPGNDTGSTVSSSCVDNTVIALNGGSALNITIPNNSLVRVTGITFQPGASPPANTLISVTGTDAASTQSQLRLDHLHFGNWTNTVAGPVVNIDNTSGVMDHVLLNGGFMELIEFGNSAWKGVGSFGDNSWASNTDLGGGDVFFVEDSTFANSTGAIQSLTDVDSAGAGRYVVRHSTIRNYFIGHHGTETPGRQRGGRQFEFYQNNFVCINVSNNNCDTAGMIRAGTGVIWGNSFSQVGGPSPTYNAGFKMQVYRATGGNLGGWGGCDGTGSWDNNDGVVYTSGSATSVNGQTITDTSQSFTANEWGPVNGAPFSIRNTTAGCGSEISSSTSNTISYKAADGPGSTCTFAVGQSYQVLRATACIDQAGHGKGNLLSGNPATPTGWVADAIEPITIWNNTLNAGVTMANGFWTSDSARILLGRDVIFCSDSSCAKAGYTPFTYPHPLQNAPPPAPAPSFSLTPISFNYGNEAVGVPSSNQAFTLTNTGNASGTISSITISGTNAADFSQTNTCGTLPATLAAAASCTINAKFTPSASGSRSATLTATDTPDSISTSSSLSGTGTNSSCPQNQPVGPYTLCGESYNDISSGTSVSVNYSPVAGNGIIAWAAWCFNSSCNSPTTGITATIGDNINATEACFAVSPNSPFVLNGNGQAAPSGDFQEYYIWYCPSIPAGVTSFTMTPSSGGLSFLNLAVSEWLSGSLAASCSPTSACFESVDTGSVAGNTTGGTSASFSTSGPTVNANDLLFAISQVACCSFTGSPGSGFTGITVAPAVNPGTVSEAKSVTSIGIQTATSTWTGGTTPWFGVIAPIKAFGSSSGSTTVTLSPSSVVFSTRVVGNGGPGQAITLSNTGTNVVSITSIALSGTNRGDFSQSNNCGATLAVGTNCNITVNFLPTALGSRSASLVVTDNATGSPQSVPLSGTGTAASTMQGITFQGIVVQ